MEGFPSVVLTDHFRDLPDPRLGPLCRHELLDIIGIAICAALAGQHTWTDIAFYGQDHAPWLQTFLRLPNGIPSHDTFRYVFTRLDPLAFQRCFSGWIEALCQATGLQHLAIDGKTLRGSRDRAHGGAALHLVSAWATAHRVTLGQVAVADKSNEITAIPRLLEIVDVTGAVVTIDAMGCQKDIAAKIRAEGADYVLAVKDNQPRLLEDLRAALTEHLDRIDPASDPSYLETVDEGHGRKEVRAYTLVTDLSQIRDQDLWQDLHSVCLAVSTRTVGTETSVEARYYIGSWRGTVADYAEVIRGHWGIENQCHWVLDVVFGEDGRRNGAEHGAENLAWLRRMALAVLRNDTTCTRSLHAKSAKALADHAFLLQLLHNVSGVQEGT